MDPVEYITSELFIHDELAEMAEKGIVAVVPRWWREHRKIPPCLIIWPREPAQDDEGNIVEDAFYMDLPEDEGVWREAMKEVVERVQAYGLMLLHQRKDEVCAIFETHNGTKSWHFPIKLHGVDRVLKDPTTKTDEEFLGLFWRPTRE